jgi:predicted DNA-binding transcriptional regulator YafY
MEVAMRADRLLSILMLLQTRPRLTARQLAEELEVSKRTIYRDIDALCAAGVPIYADYGRGGGYALLDSYRTDLTGLTDEEIRALFMLSIPAPLAELGVGQRLKAALLKLSAALPAERRGDEQRTRQRIHLDSVAWSQSKEPVPHLPTVQRALWQDRRLRLTYRLFFEAQGEWVVDPYGLVAKTATWYLVCGRQESIRVLRVSRILEAEVLEETFERPADLDLGAFWSDWCAEIEGNRRVFVVSARIAPKLVRVLPHHFGQEIRPIIAQAGPVDEDGWITLELPFETLEDARERILGYGGAVEVLRPRALRLSVADFARQIVARYEV